MCITSSSMKNDSSFEILRAAGDLNLNFEFEIAAPLKEPHTQVPKNSLLVIVRIDKTLYNISVCYLAGR